MIFWFTSSIAWASGLSGLKDATNKDSVFKSYAACGSAYPSNVSCGAFDGVGFGAATVSVVGACLACVTGG